MLLPDQYVQLDKIAQQNAGPLPETYWCRGHLVEPPQVGRCIVMMRTERCGREPGEPEVVKCLGAYSSSPVRELLEQPDGGVIAITANSHWRITPLREPKEA
jgi:hypothetical protein